MQVSVHVYIKVGQSQDEQAQFVPLHHVRAQMRA